MIRSVWSTNANLSVESILGWGTSACDLHLHQRRRHSDVWKDTLQRTDLRGVQRADRIGDDPWQSLRGPRPGSERVFERCAAARPELGAVVDTDKNDVTVGHVTVDAVTFSAVQAGPMISGERSLSIAMIGTRGVPARYGGFETAVEEIGTRLAQRGHTIVVYCRNSGQNIKEYQGMHLVNLPALRRRSFETLSHTALSVAHAATRRPDMAFVFNAANAPLLPVLRARRIPVAVHVDGIEWQRAKWQGAGRRYYKWAERACARSGLDLIADSRGIQDHLLRAYGVESHFIPYGAPILSVGSLRLGELGLETRRFHLVVARFEPENHVLEIVRGYIASSASHPLIVVGSAVYGEEYSALVKRAAEDDPRVRFLGGLFDQELLDQLYGNAASYLHGHSVGGTNPSLLRALGAGATPIAYDVSFNREVAGEDGEYFTTPEELGSHLHLAETEPEAWHIRGVRLRERMSELYRWDHVADDYEKLARDVVRRWR